MAQNRQVRAMDAQSGSGEQQARVEIRDSMDFDEFRATKRQRLWTLAIYQSSRVRKLVMCAVWWRECQA